MSILIIEKATNRHHSTAETAAEIATPLPAAFKTVDLGRKFDAAVESWDVATSTVKPLPTTATEDPADKSLRLTLINAASGTWTNAQRDDALKMLLKRL